MIPMEVFSMPSRFVAKVVLLGLAALGMSAILSAQSAQRQDGGKVSVPNLSGTWGVSKVARNGYTNPGYSITNVEPEMTPWALERYKKIREDTVPKDPERLKRVGMWDRGRENLDPSEIHCLPWGPTRLFT